LTVTPGSSPFVPADSRAARKTVAEVAADAEEAADGFLIMIRGDGIEVAH